MNGKQRIASTISHKKTDRAPLAYEATFEVTETLVKYFGLDKMPELQGSQVSTFHDPSIGEKALGLQHEIALQKLLGVDLATVACPLNSKKTIGNWFGMPLVRKEKDGTIIGAWDMRFREYEYQSGTYIELDGYPLANAEMNELERHPLPEIDLFDYDLLKEVVPNYSDFYILLNMNGCFDFARYMRGTEQFLMDLALEPQKAEVLLEKVNDFAMAYLDKCMEKCAGMIDGVYCGDDFGTQRGLIFSPDIWRKYMKPRYKKLVEKVHSYGLKYCHHTCGGVRPIIRDLIEVGFDILNPIQPLAIGMEPAELAEEFGKDITFYGAIDEQQTLPYGKPQDVKNEVNERLRTLGKHNGYIVAPSHGFQPDTPIENILAMYEAVLGYQPGTK